MCLSNKCVDRHFVSITGIKVGYDIKHVILAFLRRPNTITAGRLM